MARFEHTAMAACLLCGFVFEMSAFIPLWGVLMLLSGLMPQAAPLPRLYQVLVFPRLKPADAGEDAAPWRTAAFVTSGILGLGTLVLLIGDAGLAWVFGLVAAALGALAGVGRLCLGCHLHGWRRSA